MAKNLEEIKEWNLIVFPAKIKKEKKNEAPKNDFVSCNVFPKKKEKKRKMKHQKMVSFQIVKGPFMTRATRTTTGQATTAPLHLRQCK